MLTKLIGFIPSASFALIAAGAIGFAAAETYERTVPWGLEAQRDRLDDQINHPASGYKAQVKRLDDDLVRCQGNRQRLESGLKYQSDKVLSLSAESEKKLAAAAKVAADNRSEVERLEAQAKRVGNTKLVGADSCARMFEADRLLLENLQ